MPQPPATNPITLNKNGQPRKRGGGKKGRSGVPKGNFNALRRGGRINYKRLVVGELPQKMVSIKREAQKYRRGLEAEVLNIKGDISFMDAHAIDTASAATIAAGISRWLLRNRIETMTIADIRGCGMDILKAKQKRDTAVASLGLDIPPEPVSLDAYVTDAKAIVVKANGKGELSSKS
jgi:hypothetical protein